MSKLKQISPSAFRALTGIIVAALVIVAVAAGLAIGLSFALGGDDAGGGVIWAPQVIEDANPGYPPVRLLQPDHLGFAVTVDTLWPSDPIRRS